MTIKKWVSTFSVKNLKDKALLFLVTGIFSSSIFADCDSGDVACAAKQTFDSNFGPHSSVVYMILGAGAIGALMAYLTTHNPKILLVVVVAAIFIAGAFAVI